MSCYQVDSSCAISTTIVRWPSAGVRKAARCWNATIPSDEREALAAWHVRKLYDMGAIEVGKVTHEIRDAVSWCRIFAFTLTSGSPPKVVQLCQFFSFVSIY